MRNATYFARECPTCGRSLQVKIQFMGKRVTCPHCSAAFLATDRPCAANPRNEVSSTLDRVESLLALSEADFLAAQQQHIH
jgi:hypothetical protein